MLLLKISIEDYKGGYHFMYSDELMHFGVKGMKWGQRKSKYVSALDAARANYKNSKKSGKNTEEFKRAKKAYKKEKENNKKAINEAYNNIQDSRTLTSKAASSMGLSYNNATYKKAAKNMVNKGMDQKTAVSKAKMSAWVNAGMMVAGSLLYSNRNKIVSSVKKYANQKAIQKANRGLARIGTFQLEKVAKNVYQEVMR